MCLGMLKHRRLGRIHEYSPSDVCSDRMNRELQRRARSNGYSFMVSVEGHGSVNERVPHHRVVSGVVRDAQTSASRSHTRVQTLGCVLGSDNALSRVSPLPPACSLTRLFTPPPLSFFGASLSASLLLPPGGTAPPTARPPPPLASTPRRTSAG